MCEDLELQSVVLDRLLKAATKKGRQLFEEKVHPRQNPGYAYTIRPLHSGLNYVSVNDQ